MKLPKEHSGIFLILVHIQNTRIHHNIHTLFYQILHVVGKLVNTHTSLSEKLLTRNQTYIQGQSDREILYILEAREIVKEKLRVIHLIEEHNN